jgi:uncharacterized protein YjbJ (UPF0337 family)
MDKDRIKGSAQQAKGKVKEFAGKVTGDKKLEGEGKADKIGGKVRNAVGSMKDALRGKSGAGCIRRSAVAANDFSRSGLARTGAGEKAGPGLQKDFQEKELVN